MTNSLRSMKSIGRLSPFAVVLAIGVVMPACEGFVCSQERIKAIELANRGAGGLGGRRAHAPDVIPGQANVRGSLDKEIIRRIIRRHINEVKYCYEQELTKKASLGGRIMVQFTIAASGQVIASVLQNSTMGNAKVENCTVQAVRRWEFPKPLGGGIVIVSYPFVLTPAGGGE